MILKIILKTTCATFESQINDIKIWSKKNKKGQVVIRNQANKVIDKYRVFNYLKREKKELAHQLASRIDFIDNEKPILTSKYNRENEVLTKLFKQKENLKALHKKREQDVVSDINMFQKN